MYVRFNHIVTVISMLISFRALCEASGVSSSSHTTPCCAAKNCCSPRKRPAGLENRLQSLSARRKWLARSDWGKCGGWLPGWPCGLCDASIGGEFKSRTRPADHYALRVPQNCGHGSPLERPRELRPCEMIANADAGIYTHVGESL